jgi:hypothetical protein
MPKRRKPDPLLLRVCAELGAGRISEGEIRDAKVHVDGICDGRRIIVNPAPAMVDTVIHECIHRLHPEWSESYVRGRTTRLLRALTDEQVQTIYGEYQRRKSRRKTAVILEG